MRYALVPLAGAVTAVFVGAALLLAASAVVVLVEDFQTGGAA